MEFMKMPLQLLQMLGSIVIGPIMFVVNNLKPVIDSVIPENIREFISNTAHKILGAKPTTAPEASQNSPPPTESSPQPEILAPAPTPPQVAQDSPQPPTLG